MEENLAESGVDINADINVDEEIPSDNEIETIQNATEIETDDNENKINLNKDLENNSDANKFLWSRC